MRAVTEASRLRPMALEGGPRGFTEDLFGSAHDLLLVLGDGVRSFAWQNPVLAGALCALAVSGIGAARSSARRSRGAGRTLGRALGWSSGRAPSQPAGNRRRPGAAPASRDGREESTEEKIRALLAA